MVNLEAKKAVCRKLNISWDDIGNNGLFTAEDIQDYVNAGAIQAYDYRMWDFAEHSKTGTLLSGDITNGFVDYPNDIMPSSIYYLTIDGKEYDKKTFSSYTKYFENNATAEDKFWSEFKRMIFFNANACSAGQVIDIYGKRAFRQLSGDSDLLPFSPDTDNEEYSGNQAIVLLAYAEALSSDKKKNSGQAKTEIERAMMILDRLAGQMEVGRASEQVKDRPMFDVPDMFRGQSNGNSSIGTFSI